MSVIQMLAYIQIPIFVGSFQCRLGWHDSENFAESSYQAQGLVYKNVMAKTRKEKGKEAELHVSWNTGLSVAVL